MRLHRPPNPFRDLPTLAKVLWGTAAVAMLLLVAATACG
jgi:hypothetical protein